MADPQTDERGRRAVRGSAAPRAPELPELGEESDELRQIREFSERAFRPPSSVGIDVEPDVSARRSAAAQPAPGTVPPADPEAAGARLLQNIVLPDLPVRWDAKVLQYLEWFKDDPRGHAILTTWLRRLGRFEPHLRRALAERGMPQDLVYVAMNESGFVPTARSRVGAVGLWQFMPDAGSIYGLRQDHWRDERRDPIRSTASAALYLEDLYARFGDWHLVLAAYNMGYNGLLRSIRKYNTNDYWALSRMEAGLPWDTTTYVPKVLAAAVIGKNRERFGFGDVRPDALWSFDTVTVPTSCDLGLVARAAGVSREDVAGLNPGLLRGRTPPDTQPYEVRIPASKTDEFRAGMRKLRPQWSPYKRASVRVGETIERIAHRYRTTPRALRDLNGIEAGRGVRAGDAVVVPNVSIRPDVEPQTPPLVALPNRAPPSDRRRVLYEALDGDTLGIVATAFGVTVTDLRAWNDVAQTANLHAGQWLQVFVPTDADLSGVVALDAADAEIVLAGSDAFLDRHEVERGRRRMRVRVESGDTLTGLAERYDLTVGSLCRINQIDPREPILAGQELVVYYPIDRVPGLARAQPEVVTQPAEVTPTLEGETGGAGTAPSAATPATTAAPAE